MNRLGFTKPRWPQAWERLKQIPAVNLTLMTHFAEADGERGVRWQLERFQAHGRRVAGPVSLANSAAILRHPQAHGDWVRPGIMLYGASPFAEQPAEAFGLRRR
jgi:alanine racemase